MRNKGFSIIEFLVITSIIAVLGIIYYGIQIKNSRTTKNASDIVNYSDNYIKSEYTGPAFKEYEIQSAMNLVHVYILECNGERFLVLYHSHGLSVTKMDSKTESDTK